MRSSPFVNRHNGPTASKTSAASPPMHARAASPPPAASRPASRPAILHERACRPPVTRSRYHALLDQQLQRVLDQHLGLPVAQIAALHHKDTLSAIAGRQHRDPATVLAALKTVTAAWDEGKVIL